MNPASWGAFDALPADFIGPPLAPWDWRTKTHGLIDSLVKDIADPALAEEPDAEVVNSRNSGHILIESGKEDLEYAGALLRILDGLDESDRDAAYHALYLLIRGTQNIAGYGIIPAAALHRIDAAHGASLRARKSKKTVEKHDLVQAVIAKIEGTDHLPIKNLVAPVSDHLKQKGYKKGISERQLSRIIRTFSKNGK